MENMFSPRLDVRLKAEYQYKKHSCPGRLTGETRKWSKELAGLFSSPAEPGELSN